MKIVELKSVTAANVPASYGATNMPDYGTDQLSELTIVSTLDADVVISFDGATDHKVVPSYSSRIIDPEDVGNFVSGKVYVKRIGTPTSGVLYFEGIGKD